MSTSQEAREKLAAKQDILAKIFESAKKENNEYDFDKARHPEIDNLPNTTAKLEKIHQIEAELNDLFDEVEALVKAETGYKKLQERTSTPVN
ncbi:MAG: hypothetical protein ACE5JU_09915, partial [Candidatus Binatia bacterium]